jgi:hypothetical protein
MLLRFSLIEVNKLGVSEVRTYRVHSLVQLATRAWLKHKEQLDYWKDEALCRVKSTFPSAEEQGCDWKLCVDLFPHVRKVLALDLLTDHHLERADLLCKAACYQCHRGGYQGAEVARLDSLDIRGTSPECQSWRVKFSRDTQNLLATPHKK